jgi:hypothetical protein
MAHTDVPPKLFFLTISELNGAPTALVHGLATTLLLARVAASQLTLLVPEEHGLNVRENRIVHAWRGGAVTLGNLAAVRRSALTHVLADSRAPEPAHGGRIQCELPGQAMPRIC